MASPSHYWHNSTTSSDVPVTVHNGVPARDRGATISLTLLAGAAVALRLFARRRTRSGLGKDDWFILSALALAVGSLGVDLFMISGDMGIPMSKASKHDVVLLAKGVYAAQIIYCTTITMVKISILLMYCRAFQLRNVRTGSWILGTLIVTWAIVVSLLFIFLCSPIQGALNPFVPSKCLPIKNIVVGAAIPHIITNAAMLSMPVFHVWKLNLPRIQRVKLTIVFLLGGLGIFASAYRLAAVWKQGDNGGFSKTVNLPTIWSHIELCTAIIGGCLPCMRPLLVHALRVFGVDDSRRTDVIGTQGTIGGTMRPGHKLGSGGSSRHDEEMT